MRKTNLILTGAALLCAALTSCSKTFDAGETSSSGKIVLKVVCAGDTRSSFGDGSLKISSFCVFAYRNGELAAAGRSDGPGVELRLDAGERYALFAALNCEGITPPASITGLDTLRVRLKDYSSIAEGYFPMSAVEEDFLMPASGGHLEMRMRRIISKYRLRVRKDLHYCNFEINSARIRQASLDFTPFAPGGAACSVCDGDSASAFDIESLQRGEYVDFYTLENCQGCIEGNEDPWMKIPENIPGKEGLCSYMEIGGSWTTPGASSEINYRMYLGRDNCSDLNVERSLENCLTLVLTDMGSIRASWKVDRFDEEENRELKFPSSEMEIVRGSGDNTLEISSDPDGVAYYVKIRNGSGEDEGLLVDSRDGKVNLRSDSEEGEDAEVLLELYTWDGLLCDTMTVRLVQAFRNQGYIGSFHNLQFTDEDFHSLDLVLDIGSKDPKECVWTISDANPKDGFPSRAEGLEYDGRTLSFKDGCFPPCGAFRIHGEYTNPQSGKTSGGDYFLDLILDVQIKLDIILYRKLVYCFMPDTPFAVPENLPLWNSFFPTDIRICYVDENYIPPYHNNVQYPLLKVPGDHMDYYLSDYSDIRDKHGLMMEMMPYGFYADGKRVKELLLDREYTSHSVEYGSEDWVEGRKGYYRFKLWF